MKANFILLLAVVAFLLPGRAYATTVPLTDFEKRLSETFDISSDGRVSLDNRYGEIKVVTWSQPRVKIDVLIKVQASDKDEFEKVLERIDVSLRGGGNSVSATTTIGSGNNNSWWSFITGGNSNDDFKIYYTVTMPATVRLDVEAKYCDVELPSLSGATVLNVGYGDLVAGKLTAATEMSISYGSARVEQVGTNSLVKLRYSEGSFRNAGELRYDGRYSEVRFGTVRGVLRLDVGYEEIDVQSATEIRLNGNYNELSVERVDRVYLDGNYTEFELGTVTQVLEVDASYGDVEVGSLLAGFDHVDIRASYTDVQIDVANEAGYTLDLSARYGDIDAPTGELSPRNVANESNTESVKGTKKGSGSGLIKVTTNYGDIEVY
ncbi:hypothetical protein LEM8419_03366 [Neolewinella maritima]|uniref:DUF4097 domain-containing protein n=1 Tax=Neolewinella maritima TaxID=1383882 RepID=A0ABM9B591_9BACT|nr:DUF4097 family beta strand repeat-containing protein [Neolewinella maritima]CAH1002487.1 hypothetical protein LEM8419_03366 [Neolewinella maritima]